MCNEVLETIHQKRKKITDLLDEAKLACDRALFQEVYIWNVAAGEPTSKKRKSVPIELKSQRSWTTIVTFHENHRARAHIEVCHNLSTRIFKS